MLAVLIYYKLFPYFTLSKMFLKQITIIWCMLPEIWNTTDIIFCHSGPFFVLLPHYWPQKIKIWKTPGDIIILHVCHKLQSYDVWFLRYRAWRTEVFVISDSFLPIYPLKPEKLKFWKNEKNPWRCHYFTQVHQKSWWYAILLLRYGAWQI